MTNLVTPLQAWPGWARPQRSTLLVSSGRVSRRYAWLRLLRLLGGGCEEACAALLAVSELDVHGLV